MRADDDHIHCDICGHPIRTKILCAGGRTKDAEITTAENPTVVPLPNGKIGLTPVRVPICEDCKPDVEAAAEEIKKQIEARARIVLPGNPGIAL